MAARLGSILVPWDVRTKCHRLGVLQTADIYLSHSGGCKSKIKALADSVSGEDLRSSSDGCLLAGSSHGRRDRGAPWGLILRTQIAFTRALPS